MIKQKKLHNIRHGDLALIGIANLPTGLKASTSKVLLAVGSGGNPHSFDTGTFYPVKGDEFIIGYLKAKGTTLLHREHGKGKTGQKKAKIVDGLYQIRRQSEYTPQGLKLVID